MSKPPEPPFSWREKDEFALLTAVLEISNEPVESYNPRINLFDRIEKVTQLPLPCEEVLAKIKELRKNFYRNRRRLLANLKVKKNRVFYVSKKIWERRNANSRVDAKRRVGNENAELKDLENDAQRSGGNEMELKDGENATQSVKTNQPGLECSEFSKSNSNTSCTKANQKQVNMFKHKQEQFNKKGIDAKLKLNGEHEELKDKGLCFRCGSSEHFIRDCTMQNKVNKFKRKQEQFKKKGIDAKLKLNGGYEELKDKGLCFRCGGSEHFVRDCTKQNKTAEQLTKEQNSKDNSKGITGLQVETENTSKELSTGLVFASKIRRDELECKEPAKYNEAVACVTKASPQEAFSRKRMHELTKKRKDKKQKKQKQKQRSLPATKKQKTDVSCFECGNFGHISRDCVQKKVVKQPTEQQITKDISKVGLEPEAVNNESRKSSCESAFASSQPDSHELTSEKHIEENPTVPQSCSDYRTSDNMKTNLKSNDCEPTSEHRKHYANELMSNNKFEGSSNPCESFSEQRIKKCDSTDHGSYQHASEQKRANELTSNNKFEGSSNPCESFSDQRIKKCDSTDYGSNQHASEQRTEKFSSDFETGYFKSLYKHNKEFNGNQHIISRQQDDEWRHESTASSHPDSHRYTSEQTPRSMEATNTSQANSYHLSSNNKAKDSIYSQSVSHQYTFENMKANTANNFNFSYHKPTSEHTRMYNNFRPNCVQPEFYRPFIEHRMRETNNFNLRFYNHMYENNNHHNGFRPIASYHNEASDQGNNRESYRLPPPQMPSYRPLCAPPRSFPPRPPLPTEPYPYQPPPPPLPAEAYPYQPPPPQSYY